jgi:hypothetical protein
MFDLAVECRSGSLPEICECCICFILSISTSIRCRLPGKACVERLSSQFSICCINNAATGYGVVITAYERTIIRVRSIGDRGSEERYNVCCSFIKLIPSLFGFAKRMWSGDCFNLQLIIKNSRDYGQSECTTVAEEKTQIRRGSNKADRTFSLTSLTKI